MYDPVTVCAYWYVYMYVRGSQYMTNARECVCVYVCVCVGVCVGVGVCASVHCVRV